MAGDLPPLTRSWIDANGVYHIDDLTTWNPPNGTTWSPNAGSYPPFAPTVTTPFITYPPDGANGPTGYPPGFTWEHKDPPRFPVVHRTDPVITDKQGFCSARLTVRYTGDELDTSLRCRKRPGHDREHVFHVDGHRAIIHGSVAPRGWGGPFTVVSK